MVEVQDKSMAEEMEEKLRNLRVDDEEDDEGPEEGEIVEESEETGSSMGNPAKSLVTKHPLEHSWTFWFDNPSARSKESPWGTSISSIYTFSTVEDFWRHKLKSTDGYKTEMLRKCILLFVNQAVFNTSCLFLSLFSDDIYASKFLYDIVADSIYNNIHHPSKLAFGADFHCFKNKIEPKWEDPVCANGGKWTMNFSRGKSDTSWLYTLLAMIGEQFDYGDEICGAVVSVRSKGDKISIWTKNAANEAAQVSIGKQWKDFLDYNEPMGFIFHEDAKKLDKNVKNKYTV